MISEAQIRAIALILYIVVLLAVQSLFVDSGLRPNENAIWLYGGIASLLFGSHILNPYFTPPSGALINGVTAMLALLSALPVVLPWTSDAYVLGATISFCAIVALVSILLLILRSPFGRRALNNLACFRARSRRVGQSQHHLRCADHGLRLAIPPRCTE